MADKVRELAEKLTDETPEEKERILRAELEPSWREQLAAELQGWLKKGNEP